MRSGFGEHLGRRQFGNERSAIYVQDLRLDEFVPIAD